MREWKAYHLGQYGDGALKSATCPWLPPAHHFTPFRKRRTSSWLPMNSNERHSSQSRNISRNSSPDLTSYHWSFSFRTPEPP